MPGTTLEGPWTKAAVIVAVLFGALALWQTISIFKLSELGADIRSTGADVRATNTRIDQTYATLLQQENDIGSIKGNLQAATDKITAAAARSEELSSRLTAMVDKQTTLLERQDAQIASVKEIQGSVTSLVNAVAEQRGELIKIEDKIETPSRPFPQKKTELLDDSYVFAPFDLVKAIESQQKDAGIRALKVVDFSDHEIFEKLASANPEIFRNMFWVTKDAAAAAAFQQYFRSK